MSRRLSRELPPLLSLSGLQARLNRLGWADLEVTGEFDEPTRLAVWCLQQQLDRPDTEAGTVDKQTFRLALLPEEEER